MNISKSGYYKWLKRDGRLNRYETTREWLKIEILETNQKHKTWGYRHRAQVIRNAKDTYFSDLLCHLC